MEDRTKTEDEIKKAEQHGAPPLRRIPLVVLTKAEPFVAPLNVMGLAPADLERNWLKGAEYLVKLEPDTPHILATGQPDLVIQSIRLIIDRAKQGK